MNPHPPLPSSLDAASQPSTPRELSFQERVLAGLRVLLGCFNGSVMLASIGLAPRKTSFGWRTGDAVGYLVQLRDWSALPWLLLASLVLS